MASWPGTRLESRQFSLVLLQASQAGQRSRELEQDTDWSEVGGVGGTHISVQRFKQTR